jgi:hypothetical protein
MPEEVIELARRPMWVVPADSITRLRQLLLAERAALSQTSLAAAGLAQDLAAAAADNDRLCVAEHGGNVQAAGALHVLQNPGERRVLRNKPLQSPSCAVLNTPQKRKEPKVVIFYKLHDTDAGKRLAMKKELGDCTRRLSLCLRASSSRLGCRRSTASCPTKR